MSDQLSKNILATIIYYDGLDYPLTAFEVWRYLIRTDYYNQGNALIEVSLLEIMKHLESKELAVFIRQLNGFYFLKERDNLVSKRTANGKISTGKLKRLRRIAWVLRFVPFVRMIGVTGGLAMKNANAKSDWDLLLVIKYGKIWTGRTLITLVTHFLGRRRYGNKIIDRVCLNFFITDQSLEVITKDLFSANEYMFLFPLFGWETYHRFQIKNHWIKGMKPHYGLDEISPLKLLSDSLWSRKIRQLGEKMIGFDLIENILRKIEKKRIMNNPKTHQEGSLVYANDDALVFLPSPHGPKIFEQFKEKVNQLSV
ncbi:MAG: hypothetical protein ACD_14C00041G0004 [uncultured bacterium]|nr:MAG: hypothetical protein ACD_14C00041G0004 [uncultured bacterium]KKQ44425.1 MAG: hypothetical protein US63_C0027G0006 [Candidatus Moranbacteria bacterium GW2011_GWC2_37_8]KKQ63336.1 MAG: hypothetical protein US82_C0001G0005 [Parcubacteria group bacterium GW2011_GWC1_38_22]